MKNAKRFAAILLAAAMMLMAVGCGKSGDGNGGEAAASVYADSTAVLTVIWDKMEQFPAMGGGMDAPVDGAPGPLSISDTDTMTYALLIPAEVQEKITDISTLLHMMNANTFTGASMMLDGMDADTAAQAIRDNFRNNQFMCGFPDKIVILSVDGYVVYAYGKTDNIDSFKTQAEALENARVLVEENYES